MARTSLQDHDNRTPARRELAERALALPDPIGEPEPPKLADLLHPDDRGWPIQFDRYLSAILDNASRRPEPVQVPDVSVLRPLLWSCQSGLNGEYDNSVVWRQLWGTKGEQVQSRVRGLFAMAKGHKHPRPDAYELLVHTLAEHVIRMHQAAAEVQRELARKRAEKLGPKAKAQAAAAVLEALPAFQVALMAFDAAARDAAGSRYHPILHGLPHLEAAARRELQ